MIASMHPWSRRLIACSLLGSAAAGLAQGSALTAEAMAARVQACTACHGKEGRASSAGYLPRIAGKPAGYLYNQLVNFREGRRQNAAMTVAARHAE